MLSRRERRLVAGGIVLGALAWSHLVPLLNWFAQRFLW